MSFAEQFRGKIREQLSSQFVRNVGWLGSSELILRVVRLGVTVVLARLLSPDDYGLAAIVSAVSEFTRVFIDVGVNAKIIQADEAEVEELSNSGYWLNWIIFVGLFFLQCLVAFPISLAYNNSTLIPLICVSGLPYLIWPFSSIKLARIHRDNNLKITAIHNVVQNSLSHILTIVFALLNFHVWAIVLPWVITAPIGVYIYYANHQWRPTSAFTTKHWKEILSFGKNILGVQLLKTLRNNLDYLIVGRFLGIQALGLYYFGFNAGLGISLSVISALGTATFPYLCAVRSDPVKFKQRYFGSLKKIAFVIIPLVFLQVSLAPLYVPIVFGQKWVVAIPVLILICLSALPRPFADAASQLLVASDKPHLVLRWDVLFTTLFIGALTIGVQWQAVGVASAVLIVHLISMPLFTLWATYYTFPPIKQSRA